MRVKSRLPGWPATVTVILSGLLFSHLLYAQVDTGTVEGVVRNPAGEGAVSATVILRNEGNLLERTVRTHGNGSYLFTSVRPGTYTLKVELKAFAPATRTGVVVGIHGHVVADFSLQPAQAEVEAGTTPPPPSAKAARAGAQPVKSRGVADLPLVLRNYTMLAQLYPGVTSPQQTGRGLQNSGSFSANGVRFAQNNYLLDGVDNNNHTVDFVTGASYIVLPSLDAIQEFKVQSPNYSPIIGGTAGAVLNTVTRSGTSELHGSAWEYFGTQSLNAADFFDNAGGIGRAEFRKNQFGATLGGPLGFGKYLKKSSKAFFFADYQGTRIHQGVPETETVPTLAERNSGFTNYSDLITAQPNCTRGPDLLGRTVNCGTIFDPATTHVVLEGGKDPITGLTATGTGFVRNPFPGNTIPANRVDPVAAGLLSLYPVPTSSGIYDNYTVNAVRTEHDDSADIRLDAAPNNQDSMFVKYSYYNAPASQAPPFAGFADGGGYVQVSKGQSGVFSETHVFSSTFVNEVRLGGNWLHAGRVQPFANNLSNIPGTYGIAAIPQVSGNGGLPTLLIGSLSQLGSSPFLYANDYDYTAQVSDNVFKSYGAHRLNFGGEARRIKAATLQPPNSRGQFTFSGNFTSIPNILDPTAGIAQFAVTPTFSSTVGGVNFVGGPNQVLASSISNFDDRRYYLGAYVQDDWKFLPKLTLTLGARWEYFEPPDELFNAEANFIPGVAGTGAQYLIPSTQQAATSCTTTTGQPNCLSTSFSNALTSAGIKLSYTPRHNLVQVKKWTNIAPRVGFAYQLLDKLVVRGGAGIYFDGLENQGVLANLGGNYPFELNYAFNSPNDGAPITYPFSNSNATIEQGLVGVTLQAPGADANRMVLRGFDQQYKAPYTEGLDFSGTYQLDANSTIEVGYAGSLGRHLDVNPGLNEPNQILTPGQNIQSFVPFSTFAYGASLLSTEGTSYYHSAHLTYTRKFGNGLSLLANYTNSEVRTDARDLIFPGGDQPYRAPYVSGAGIRYDYGLANFNVRNALHFSGGYDLPAGRGKRYFGGGGILAKVVGDWSIHWILTWQSGQPVTIPCNITTAAGEGCNALLAGSPGSHGPNQFWSPSAFMNPLVATSTGQSDLTPLGGAPSQAVGPGLQRLDFALHKVLKTSENTHVEFRIEGYNVTNHPNFAAPSILNFSNPAYFGQISATRDNPYDPRQIQFAVRIYF